MAIVASRNFGVELKGNQTVCLVPFVDMLNHRRKTKTHWYYSHKQRAFIVMATEDVAKGDEIYTSYGDQSNYQFFLSYGFVSPLDHANEYHIEVFLDKDDPLYAQKTEQTGQDHCGFGLRDGLDEDNMKAFISWVRFVLYQGSVADLEEKVLVAFEQQNEFDYIDIEFEKRTWLFIVKIIKEQLDRYGNSYEEDLGMLQRDQEEKFLTENEKNCVLFRS